MTKTEFFLNLRWRTAAILKIVKSPYLSDKSSDFDEIWYTASDIELDIAVTWPKNEIFKIEDNGSRHLKNRFFCHKSSTDCPISAKLCTRKQTACWLRGTKQKMQMCKIEDGGRPPFWKSLNHHISVKNCQILIKFGTLHQILNVTKIAIFEIQDGGGRHFENRFFGHYSLTDCPISAERHADKGYGTKNANV